MKKTLKGFTLLELIIVMAILTILMTAIMNMFKPVRETYVDATLYESQRTSQNGVVTYITESIRYSTDLGLYTKNKVSSAEAAVEKFTDAYLEANNVKTTDSDYSQKRTATLKKIKNVAEVIIIDNTANKYHFGNSLCTGRVLRRKFVDDTSYNATTDPEYKKYKPLTSAVETAGSNECRLALGAAYYGDSSYTISFGVTQDASTKKGDADDGIAVTVASNASHGLRSNKVISDTGLVMCKNQSDVGGMFDTVNFDSGSATGANTKVYIVFLNDEIEITTTY
ncbi:MAG: prepilin-type N-terminal cleavage/methylation domain-containing protein [Oscillospiraceae bacterium]|nr:prepilin-type N-terminal cleavage/methylation domain-containing protein [Oscillospiraceae bacterium]